MFACIELHIFQHVVGGFGCTHARTKGHGVLILENQHIGSRSELPLQFGYFYKIEESRTALQLHVVLILFCLWMLEFSVCEFYITKNRTN